MGIIVISVVDIRLSDQISGPPSGWRSAAIGVAMMWEIMEGQSGRPPW